MLEYENYVISPSFFLSHENPSENYYFLPQVAGLPTNVSFLQKLANHCAFQDGKVETHFIEHFKDELFVDPNNSVLAKEAYDTAKFSAAMVAACVIEKEHSAGKENLRGRFRSQTFSFMPHFVEPTSTYICCCHVQEAMAYSPFGTLLLLSESIIVQLVQQNLSGRMNMTAVARFH